MTSLDSRLIVITGGGGGIGRATALLCAKRGDRVAILDKNGESAKQAADAARDEGASGVMGLACDVTDESQVAQAFALIFQQFGAPYGIFANAGIDIGGLIHEMPLELWQQMVDTWSATDAGGAGFRVGRLYLFTRRIYRFRWRRQWRLQRNQGSHLLPGALHGH
jgi:NAD(P)-dependent dehydrogenase (short-subunit alcohol dehydrogenase family)